MAGWAKKGTLGNPDVLRATFAATGNGGYGYASIAAAVGYVIAAGDTFEYEVWWEATGSHVALDFDASGGLNLRDHASDQNALSAHPNTDLGTRPLSQWYKRTFSIGQAATGLIGATINTVTVAVDWAGLASGSTYAGRIRNAYIRNAQGQIVKTFYQQGSPVPAGANTAYNTNNVTANLATVPESSGAGDGPVSAITRDGTGRITGATAGAQVTSQITRNVATGLIASYVDNGVTRVISRDANNKITGVT